MAPHFPLGIDCGELGFRAAVLTADRPVALAALPGPGGSSVICEKSGPGASLPVSFPSVLKLLGSQRRIAVTEDREITAEEFFQGWFSTFAAHAAGLGQGRAAPLMLSVPTALTEVRRRGLLDAARRAGFGEVHLVDRCMAAAVGYLEDSASFQTAIVAILGYSGVELALIRGGKGRYRTLAATSSDACSEQHLTFHLMEDVVLKLRNRKTFLGLKQLTILQWLGFRDRVNQVLQPLLTGQDAKVTLPPSATGLETTLEISLSAAELAVWLKPRLNQLADQARHLLEECQLVSSDVNVMILAGDELALPLVAKCLSETQTATPARGHADLVAFGAALLGKREDVAESVPAVPVSAPLAVSTPAHASAPLQASTTLAAVPVALGGSIEDQITIGSLRQRWLTGDREIALRLLEALMLSAHDLRASWLQEPGIPRAPAASQDKPEQNRGAALRLIDEAQMAIKTGHCEHAVGLSHQAYSMAKDDPDVFIGMMHVHAEASLRMSRPEEYEKAIQFLHCAYNHDQTDRNVHRALARRHVVHAHALRELNNNTKALECVALALRYEPRNEEALALQAELHAHASA